MLCLIFFQNVSYAGKPDTVVYQQDLLKVTEDAVDLHEKNYCLVKC